MFKYSMEYPYRHIRGMSLMERYPSLPFREKHAEYESEMTKIEPSGKHLVPATANYYPLIPRESQRKPTNNDFIYKTRFSYDVKVVQPQNTPNEGLDSGRLAQSSFHKSSTKKECLWKNTFNSNGLNERTKYDGNTGFSAHFKGSRQSLTSTDQESEKITTSPRHKRGLNSTKNLSALPRGPRVNSSEEFEGEGKKTSFLNNNGDLIQWRMQRNFLDHSKDPKQELTRDEKDRENQTATTISTHRDVPLSRKRFSNRGNNKKDEAKRQTKTTFSTHGGSKSRTHSSEQRKPFSSSSNGSRKAPASSKNNEKGFISHNVGAISSTEDVSDYPGGQSGSRKILTYEENHVQQGETTNGNHKDDIHSSRKTSPNHGFKHRSKDEQIAQDNYKQTPQGSQQTEPVEEEGLSAHKKVTKGDKGLPQGKARNVQKKDNRKAIVSRRNNTTKTPQSRTSNNTNTGQRRLPSRDKVETRAIVKDMIEGNQVYQKSQKRILKWMSYNYARIIDIFKRFDVDGSGSLSMEEFCLGMKSLGAPATEEELNLMAQVLDFDNDDSIDFSEFRKLKKYNRITPKHARRSHASSPEETDRSSSSRASPTKEVGSAHRRVASEKTNNLPRLKPCTKCYVGLKEPLGQSKYDRHICLRMSSISKVSHKKSPIGQFKLNVSPDMTVYGIQRLTKAELGSTATNVRIFRRQDKKRVELLEQHKHLGEYGYEGALTSENPEMVSLFYDYTYPKLDCPLVSASLSS